MAKPVEISPGVLKEIVTNGDGTTKPGKGDRCRMHYVGTLDNGKQFDSSRDRGQPFETEIGIGRVIRGWDEGVPTMSLGEVARFTISPDKAYGPRGVPGCIPANATLTFEVELLEIKPAR